MSGKAYRAARALALAVLAVLLSGCSLLFNRPDPTVAHVGCDLVDQGGGALEFRAWSHPYDPERFLMSLPDHLLHAAVAPGRTLSEPLAVEGATCPSGAWPAGHTLPMHYAKSGGLRCLRDDGAAVRFGVETRWGSCEATIEAGKSAVLVERRTRRSTD